MTIQFHELRVKEVKRETSKAVTISFEIPVELKSMFAFTAGQYLTLRFLINGNDERRAYSISSSPLQTGTISVTVKEVEGGKVSTHINRNLKSGDKVDVMPPLGNFTTELSPSNEKQYVLIGGGSGITPLMSIIKGVLEVERESQILLVYANSDIESIIFYAKLEELIKQYKDRFNIAYQLSSPPDPWNGGQGRLDSEDITSLLSEKLGASFQDSEYFVCGPQGLMTTVLDTLKNLQIPQNQIHKESFTVEENKQSLESSEVSEKVDKVSIRIYGTERKIKSEDDDTILISGVKAGIDPPFSCQIGACSTCRAKLISGKVHMDAQDALTEDEIEDGYILTCTSHPLTNDVIVDYDD